MENEKNITAFDFGNQNIPLPTESRNTSDKTFVVWGGVSDLNSYGSYNYDNNANGNYYSNNQNKFANLYPNFLLELYRDSPTHGAIINQKANYIVGNGLKLNGKDIDVMVNPSDSLTEFLSKIILDYLLFGAFTVEVVFNAFNEPIKFFHTPFHKLRMNINKDLFFYNKDWRHYKYQDTFERYNPKNNTDSDSKIFMYDGYFPSINNVYPTPEYKNVIRPITTDIAVQEFNLNNIKNHFSLSTIITFFNGANVSEDVKRQLVNEIKNTYTGENGKKVMVDFQGKDGKGAEVKPLSAGDWDKAYVEIAKNVELTILKGHEAAPALFNIQTAGSLGGNQELANAYRSFKDNYIAVKRGQIESALMQLFSQFKPLQGILMFKDKETFKTEIDKNKLLYMTIDELRAIDDLQPLPNGEGTKLLSAVATPIAQPAPATPAPTANTTAKITQADIDEAQKKKSSGIRRLTGDDYEAIKHLGKRHDDFDVVEEMKQGKHKFSTESDIADFVIGHDIKGLTLDELVDVLKKEGKISTNASDVQDVLTSLHESGLADVDVDEDGRIKVSQNPKADVPDTDAVSVMYKYVKRPNIKGADIIEGTRSFCIKLIENNRLYTREDIQEMGAIFGYDIYEYTGGWYHNPETGETTPYCRHQWNALKVKPKPKNNELN